MAAPDSNARFQSIDSSLTDLAEKKSGKVNNKTAYHTANELATAVGSYDNTSSGLTATTVQAAIDENAAAAASGGYTYTEVAVTETEIKNCFTSPKQILASPGAGKYYDIAKISVEYTHVSTAYTFSPTDIIGLWYYDGGSTYTYTYVLSPNVIRATGNKISQFGSEHYDVYTSDGGSTPYPPYYGVNESLVLSCYTADPTLGDGTMLIKVWYRLRTFGTEL